MYPVKCCWYRLQWAVDRMPAVVEVQAALPRWQLPLVGDQRRRLICQNTAQQRPSVIHCVLERPAPTCPRALIRRTSVSLPMALALSVALSLWQSHSQSQPPSLSLSLLSQPQCRCRCQCRCQSSHDRCRCRCARCCPVTWSGAPRCPPPPCLSSSPGMQCNLPQRCSTP